MQPSGSASQQFKNSLVFESVGAKAAVLEKHKVHETFDLCNDFILRPWH